MLMKTNERIAALHFQPNGFRVVQPGTHARCAVTGESVALDTLRYWSVEHQEAYVSCAVATRRLTGRE